LVHTVFQIIYFNSMDNSNVVPHHIAIIMDGNRRWAKEKGLPALEGHRKVADDILEPLIEYASTQGVKYLTFWAWSTENWKRSHDEVEGIMNIFRNLFTKRLDRLHKKGVRVRTIGDLSKFSDDIQKTLMSTVEKTKNNTVITVIFALNYGGRDEIIRATQKLLGNGQCQMSNDQLKKQFECNLDTLGIPDPELIVRTGGEQRLSGFLLWQSEYSELYFPSWYMPEFTREKFDEVLQEYQRRKRRFGA